MHTLKVIKTRRSVRRFKNKDIPQRTLTTVIEAARWAPSGLNNQPWKFKIIKGSLKNELAAFTHYSYIIKASGALIAVFLDNEASYHRDKDLMAIGAAIQNMLLVIHEQKLGACWLGEILNKKEGVRKHLKLPKHLELAAVIALGYPLITAKKGRRKKLESLIL